MSVVSLLTITHKFNITGNRYNQLLLPAAIFALILTFANQGMEGVHRWISIGAVKLNVAMIVLPMILLELYQVLKIRGLTYAGVSAFIILLVLFFQPDASQLTAFAIPMMIMLSLNTRSKKIRFLIAGVSVLFIVLSWIRLDHLPPVNYVERILMMVADMGGIWFVSGIISLAILPAPFILLPPKNAVSVSRYIGCYYLVILLSTLFGNFPVPLMGYGISPIVGYYLSLTWYFNLINTP
jgi:cell division protein FtsW (lipid II flippase)